jgi:hypothetical protein
MDARACDVPEQTATQPAGAHPAAGKKPKKPNTEAVCCPDGDAAGQVRLELQQLHDCGLVRAQAELKLRSPKEIMRVCCRAPFRPERPTGRSAAAAALAGAVRPESPTSLTSLGTPQQSSERCFLTAAACAILYWCWQGTCVLS